MKDDGIVRCYINTEKLNNFINKIQESIGSGKPMIKPYIIQNSDSAGEDHVLFSKESNVVTEEERGFVCYLANSLKVLYVRYLSYNEFLGKSSSQNCDILIVYK